MAKIRIYGRPGCSECGQAMAFLGDRELEFEPHDLTKERLTRGLLEEAIPEDHFTECLDRQSPFYRLFDLDRKVPNRKTIIKLILEEPGLLKVPMVIGDGRATFGWSAKRFEALFGEKEDGSA